MTWASEAVSALFVQISKISRENIARTIPIGRIAKDIVCDAR